MGNLDNSNEHSKTGEGSLPSCPSRPAGAANDILSLNSKDAALCKAKHSRTSESADTKLPAIVWHEPLAPQQDPGIKKAIERGEAAHRFIDQQLSDSVHAVPASVVLEKNATASSGWVAPGKPLEDPGLKKAIENSESAHRFIQQELFRKDDSSVPEPVARTNEGSILPAISWQAPQVPQEDPGLKKAIENSESAHQFIQQQLSIKDDAVPNTLASEKTTAALPANGWQSPRAAEEDPGTRRAIENSQAAHRFIQQQLTSKDELVADPVPREKNTASLNAISWQEPRGPQEDPGIKKAIEDSDAAHRFVQQQLSARTEPVPGAPAQEPPLPTYKPSLLAAAEPKTETRLAGADASDFGKLKSMDSSEAARGSLPFLQGSSAPIFQGIQSPKENSLASARSDSPVMISAEPKARGLEPLTSRAPLDLTTASRNVQAESGRREAELPAFNSAAQVERTMAASSSVTNSNNRFYLPEVSLPNTANSNAPLRLERSQIAPSSAELGNFVSLPKVSQSDREKYSGLVQTNLSLTAALTLPLAASLESKVAGISARTDKNSQLEPEFSSADSGFRQEQRGTSTAVLVSKTEALLTVSRAVEASPLNNAAQIPGRVQSVNEFSSVQQSFRLAVEKNATVLRADPITNSPLSRISESPRSDLLAVSTLAIAGAPFGNRGIYQIETNASRLGPFDIASAGKIAGAATNSQTLAGIFVSPVSSVLQGTGGPISLTGTAKGSFSGNILDGVPSRSVKIDPLTGQISFSGAETSLEVVRRLNNYVRPGVAQGRYLPGVEIAIACAIASAAIARSQGGAESEAKGEEKKGAANSSANASQNLYKRPSYVVNLNDSLLQIAEKFYGDERIAWLIVDINSGKIVQHFVDDKCVVELKSRQEIELPLPDEVRDFKPPERLVPIVTIVSITELDRQVRDSLASESPVSNMVARENGLPSLTVSEEPVQDDSASLLSGSWKNVAPFAGFVPSLGKAIVPPLQAIARSGAELQTYISRVDTVAPAFDAIIKSERSSIEIVVHELKSPLMAAQVSLDVLEEMHLDLSDEAFSTIQIAQNSLSKTITCSRRLLDYTKKLHGQDEAINQETIIGQSVCIDVLKSDAENLVTRFEQMSFSLNHSLESLLHFQQLEESSLCPLAKDHLLSAVNGINRCLNLINNEIRTELYLRQAACPELRKADCDVLAIATDAIASLQSLAEQRRISVLNMCKSVSVFADREKITQVLINFLSNAIKFSAENTSITISSRVSRNSLRIAVTDQGPGLDRASAKRLFSCYSRVGRQQNKAVGHGLGLSICSSIVHAHGGRVGVSSVPGRGSTFWMEISAG